jgi:hypothetical protein
MVNRGIVARALQCGALAFCALATAGAQNPTATPATPAPSLALPPDMSLPALSPAPTQQSMPPGPNPQQAPNAQMQPPPISPLAQHVDTPEAPAPQITATMNSGVRPQREEAHGLTDLIRPRLCLRCSMGVRRDCNR